MVVSSHVLHEVESLTPNIMLLHRGRLVAEGHVRQIRDLIDQHPHRDRAGLRRLPRAGAPSWSTGKTSKGVKMLAGEEAVLVETHAPDAFYARLPALSLEDGTAITRSTRTTTTWKPCSSTW